MKDLFIKFLFIFVLLSLITCVSKPNTENTKSDYQVQNIIIDVSNIIVNIGEANFDRQDSLLTEQAFIRFIVLLEDESTNIAETHICNLLNITEQKSDTIYRYILELTEKYWNAPNSPMRNDYFYKIVLNEALASDILSREEKKRLYRHKILISRNIVGDYAEDFIFVLSNGEKQNLYSIKSDYILIFFNNPDCYECIRVKEIMTNSTVLNQRIGMKTAGNLSILSIYPDTDTLLWKQTKYPSQWINAYDQNSVIDTSLLYDLSAIPSLYLLDKKKIVLLKDASIEQIISFVKAH